MGNDNAPLRKDGVYHASFSGLGHAGEGVGRVEGFTVFVPYVLPGEEADIRITEVKRNFARGRLVEVTQQSPKRVTPRCPIFYHCGGCQLQHMDYQEQLVVKRQAVVDNLTRIGHLDGITVHPALGMGDPWYYRNKAQIPFGIQNGLVVAGFYAQASHEIINLDECYIQHPISDRILRHLRDAVRRLEISVYDEKTGKGLLRHCLIKIGRNGEEAMCVLITNGEAFPHVDELLADLRQAVPQLTSIAQNINTRPGNVVLGDRSITLWGNDTVEDILGGLHFRISPQSFYQVNIRQTEVLYDQVREYANLTGTETVIDAYCGIGTISLFLARQAGKVIGVEVVPEAIEDAKMNARANNINNAEFLAGESERIIPELHAQGVRAEVVVVDPPRQGCDLGLLDAIVAMQPERIVYVSCNPSSLARDLAHLKEQGYVTREVQPVDMFPQTAHVETVVLMSRKDK